MMMPSEIKADFAELVITYQETLKDSYTQILTDAGLNNKDVIRKADDVKGVLKVAKSDGLLSYAIVFHPRNKNGHLSKRRPVEVLLSKSDPVTNLSKEYERYDWWA